MWRTATRVFDKACTYFVGRTAIIDGDRVLTYGQLQAEANRLAQGLRTLGVGPGDRVGLLLPNVLEFTPALYGIWKAGSALVQLPAMAAPDDLAFMLRESGASTLIFHEQFDERAAHLSDSVPSLKTCVRVGTSSRTKDGFAHPYQDLVVDAPADTPPDDGPGPDDLAFVGFTSGTTGRPKGVRQTHASWSHYVITAGLEVGDTDPGEVFAHGAPLTHFSQIFLLPTLMRGGTNIMLPGLDPDILVEAIERHRVTATALVPTIVYMLLDRDDLDPGRLQSLRTVVYAGSPMAPERLREAIARFGPIFVQTYAGTEPGFMTCLRKEEHRTDSPEWSERLASAGRAMFHVDISIQGDEGRQLPPHEVGEICARQDGQMVGYIDPSLDHEAMRDGWVRSGDLGYVDDEGFVFIVDRVKDMIVTGGFNVFPRQVEDVLATHPAVAQCAVFAVPDDKWGEAVKAAVVLKAGATVPEQELIDLVKQHKGGVWAPKSVDFMDAFPLNPAGKVDKRAIRAPYWRDRTRSVG